MFVVLNDTDTNPHTTLFSSFFFSFTSLFLLCCVLLFLTQHLFCQDAGGAAEGEEDGETGEQHVERSGSGKGKGYRNKAEGDNEGDEEDVRVEGDSLVVSSLILLWCVARLTLDMFIFGSSCQLFFLCLLFSCFCSSFLLCLLC